MKMSPSQKNFMRNTTVVIQEHEMWFLFHTAKKYQNLKPKLTSVGTICDIEGANDN